MNEKLEDGLRLGGKIVAKMVVAATTGNPMLSIITDPAFDFFFESFIGTPVRKRIKNFINAVGECLITLESNGKINIEDLSQDELFQTVLIIAVTLAPKIHQQEKMDLLVNAVCNAALKIDLEEDLQYVFFEYIDKLTQTHVLLLRFFVENEEKYRDVKSYEEIFNAFKGYFYQKNLSGVIFNSQDQFKLYCTALINNNLIKMSDNLHDFKDVQSSSFLILEEGESEALPMLKVTEIGKKFWHFINPQRSKT